LWVGPFEFPPRLNADIYRKFLQDNLPDPLDKMHLQNYANHMFQHDGAPAHFVITVREFLNQEYPNRWIGHDGLINWPARSPDLTPLDFFLWGNVKNCVYRVPIDDLQTLYNRIMEALAMVRPEMLQHTKNNLLRRARRCIQVGGVQFEHLGRYLKNLLFV
jgi:hypothetical protein